MRTTLRSLALAICLAGAFFIGIAFLMKSPPPHTALLVSADPAPAPAETVVAGASLASASHAPVAGGQDTDRLAAAIGAARGSYLDSVHATGLPSDLKAERRLAAFERAASELAALGPGAIEALTASLEAEADPHARLLLLTAISRTGGEGGIAGTLSALERVDDPTVEQLFLDRLARSSAAADERLLEAVLFRGEDPENRRDAMAAAVSRGDARMARLLPDLARRDPDPLLRQQALLSGARLGTSFDAGLLAGIASSDPSPEVRAGAIRLYASTYPNALVAFARDAIAAQALHSDAAPASALIDALAAAPGPEAAALLEEVAATAPTSEARRGAEAALRRRGPGSPGAK